MDGTPIVVNPNGSLNSSSNPAPAGSVVVLYGTGFGRTSPRGSDGHLAACPLPAFLEPVRILSPFSLLYVGAAPGLVEGMTQINVQLPGTPGSLFGTLKCAEVSLSFAVAIAATP